MAGTYVLPTPTDWVSCSHDCHQDRNPPSSEPGTDYGCSYGSSIYAPEAGVVADRKTSNSEASGRFVTVDFDNGQRGRMLHMSSISVSVGQRVKRGQVLGKSGASGYGDDWFYGPHGHQTLWSTQEYRFCSTCTIDFEKYVGAAPAPPEEEDPMPRLTKVNIERSTPQRVEGEEEYIRLNDDGAVSVFTGHDVVFGEFALRFEVVKASSNAKASVSVYPKVATLDDDGNTESTTSVGIQEFPVSTGSTSVSVSLAPISVKDNQRVRFMIRCTDGLVVDITAGSFRGGYWD